MRVSFSFYSSSLSLVASFQGFYTWLSIRWDKWKDDFSGDVKEEHFISRIPIVRFTSACGASISYRPPFCCPHIVHFNLLLCNRTWLTLVVNLLVKRRRQRRRWVWRKGKKEREKQPQETSNDPSVPCVWQLLQRLHQWKQTSSGKHRADFFSFSFPQIAHDVTKRKKKGNYVCLLLSDRRGEREWKCPNAAERDSEDRERWQEETAAGSPSFSCSSDVASNCFFPSPSG